VLSILLYVCALLTTTGSVFNFNKRTKKIHELIDKLEKVRNTIDYVISCNGNMTKEEYDKILKEYY
jgi:uncharacterized hydantoinase/oxoprolinase family protein